MVFRNDLFISGQSLELILKANIFQVVVSDGERKEIIGEIRHDLKQGYDKLLELKNLEFTENNNTNWLWEFLTDISRIDRESDMFRYPFGNNLKVLFDKQTHISLVATHDNMNRAYDILRGLYDTGNFRNKNMRYTCHS